MVTRVTGISKQKLVDIVELHVKGLKCMVLDPKITLKLPWLLRHIDDRKIVKAVQRYGSIQSAQREKW